MSNTQMWAGSWSGPALDSEPTRAPLLRFDRLFDRSVNQRLPEYADGDWLAALRGELGEDGRSMVCELQAYLRRILRSAVRRPGLRDEDFDEWTQESMSQLLTSLHTFRGDAKFSTWAAAVATRVAFTELRRREAREAKHAAFRKAREDALGGSRLSSEPSPVDVLSREGVLAALDRAIDTVLSDKQRIATLALLRGVPTIEIAEQTDSNQNAVYKLVHDARLRLREALERDGITLDVVLDISDGGIGS